MPNSFVYAIQPNGDLIWARHLGKEDGSFRWEGPSRVGTGWAGFKHVFSGGDGIIYAVDPRVKATPPTGIGPAFESHPASGGDLLWYRHVGRKDGSFKWEGPKKVGTGWGDFKHIFSGGGGIIYAVDPFVEATKPTGIGSGFEGHPASGGHLWWYRHVGREDGSFQWEGPKKVGNGWDNFKHLFSDGDGIIYAVDPFVEATLPTGIGPGFIGHPSSGGNLWWYRHVGREDGSFRWAFNQGRKVGTGWAGLQQLFSGGDGVIYAVDPIVEATNPTGIGPGFGGALASGGDLRWYRHLGRDDGSFRWEGPKKVGTGWGSFQRVFSGGRDVLADLGHARRCGVADPAKGDIHLTTFGSPKGKWSHGNLTYNIDVGDSDLTQGFVDGVMAVAFRQWQNAVAFFSFTQTSDAADISIQFVGSALEPSFGESGGVLAVGYPPESGILRFDTGEGWTTDPASRQLMLSVALHEIGHVLGLQHSTSRGSIMYPYEMPNAIDNETIEVINGLYGWTPPKALEDRGSTNGPSLASAGTASFGGSNTRLYMAWVGGADDDGIYWSSLEGDQWSPQSSIPGIGSSRGPALSTGFASGPVTGLFMAWNGTPGDNSIYYAQNADPALQDWTSQRRIEGAGTSARPALAMFKGQIHMAWKGVAGDSAIYWSRFDGNDWIPQKAILGRGTSEGPALAVLANRLYMFWKGLDGDTDAYFSWLDDQPSAIWQVQQKIAYTEAQAEGNVGVNIGTSGQPAATVRGDAIVLTWKGAPGDSGIFFSRFRDDEWSGQTNVAGIGTASGPGLAALDGRLYLAWRGGPGDTGLYFSWLG